MRITVYYDYVCPFCYITSQRLDILSGEYDLDIDWKGIEIHPEYPIEGKKRGKTARSSRFAEIIRGAANEDGLKIKLPGFATNSRLSLEASEFAKTRNRFNEMHNGLYEAYFLKKQNIGDIKIILDVADEASIQREELKECLERRTMYDKIEENKREAQDNMVLGVPTLFLNGFPVHGDQPLTTLRALIERSLQRT